MIPYSAVATSKNNKKVLLDNNWRWLLSPCCPNVVWSGNINTDHGYAIDNGVYADWAAGREYQIHKFHRLLKQYGENADWIVIPDAVGDRKKTLELADKHIDDLSDYPLMLVIQDGMVISDILPYLVKLKGIFLGGSTEYKLGKMKYWAKFARDNNILCHVGRVNTVKRLNLCFGAGATSFDGSGPARFIWTAKRLTGFLNMQKRQISMFK